MLTEPVSDFSSLSFGTLLGDLYKRYVLDCIIDSAWAISFDFSDRLELYQNIPRESAAILTALQGKMGFDSFFPDKEIRSRLYMPIFGSPFSIEEFETSSPFQETLIEVLTTATNFAENAQPTGFPMLREAIRSSIVPFRNHLLDLSGEAFNQIYSRIRYVFDLAQSILKEQMVYGVFGITSSITADWPLNANDTEGAKLIEKITTQLEEIPSGLISRDRFIRMQRIAEKGASAISIILEEDYENDDAVLDQLISKLYAWGNDIGMVYRLKSDEDSDLMDEE